MKKIYTFLFLLLLANFAFAQQYAPQIEQDGPMKKIPANEIKRVAVNNAIEAMSGDFWYSYNDALATYKEGTVEFLKDELLSDTLSLIEHGGNYVNTLFLSVGMAFDLVGDEWKELYRNYSINNERVPVPFVADTSVFTLDKISIPYEYERVTDPIYDSIVDTLIIQISTKKFYKFTTLWGYATPRLPYSYNEAGVPENSDFGFSHIQIKKILLTKEDEQTLTEREFEVEGFENLNDEIIFVTFSFKSGLAGRNPENSLIGVDVNRFSTTYGVDANREGYISWKDEGLMNDYNVGLIAERKFIKEALFKDQYSSTGILVGPEPAPGEEDKRNPIYRSDVKIHIDCINCYTGEEDENIVVSNPETTSIRIQPNPATDQFTVNLNDNAPAQVQLFNLVGQVVYSTNTSDQTFSVDVSNLNKGVYMLKVVQNQKIYTSKVVVK